MRKRKGAVIEEMLNFNHYTPDTLSLGDKEMVVLNTSNCKDI